MKKRKLYFPLILTTSAIAPLAAVSCVNPFSDSKKLDDAVNFSEYQELVKRKIDYDKLFEEEKNNPAINKMQYLKSVDAIKLMHEKINSLKFIAWKTLIADITVSDLAFVNTYKLVDSVNISDMSKAKGKSFALPIMVKKFLVAYFKDSPFASTVLRKPVSTSDKNKYVYKKDKDNLVSLEDVVSSTDTIPMLVFKDITDRIKKLPFSSKEDLVNLYSTVINLLGKWRAKINGNYFIDNVLQEPNKDIGKSLKAFMPYFLIVRGLKNDTCFDAEYSINDDVGYSPFNDKLWIGEKEIDEFRIDPYNFIFKKYKDRLNPVYVNNYDKVLNDFELFMNSSSTNSESMTSLVSKILYYKMMKNVTYVNFGIQKDSLLVLKTDSGERLYFDVANDIRFLQNKAFFDFNYSQIHNFKEISSLNEYLEKANWSITLNTYKEISDKTKRAKMIQEIKDKAIALDSKYKTYNFETIKNELITKIDLYKDKEWKYKIYDEYDAENNKKIGAEMIDFIKVLAQLYKLNTYVEDKEKFTQKWEHYFDEFNVEKINFLEN